MNGPSREELRGLAEWRPDGGVISVYLDVDPADRGGGWRIELHDRLREIAKETHAGEERSAVDAASKRILARFPENGPPPSGRVQIGFVEVADGGRDVWHGVQGRLERSVVARAQAPCLTPLVRILDGADPIGVVLVALESGRAFEWSLGRLTPLGSWELEMFSGDWRERKSPQRDPQAGGTGTSAAGHDQYGQRLDSNRARFLKQLGHLVATRFGDRGWDRIAVFGEGELPRLLRAGLGPLDKLVREVPHDLIRAPDAEVAEHVEDAISAVREERDRELLDRVEEAIGSDSGAALGPKEVLQALEQGRASHVIFDAHREFESQDGESTTELMISRGLETGASITPIEGDLAERLAGRGGAVALLRY
ncbi:MAG TPA: VLRF1 family aeRF1-type release factor [Solirubrobacterales bacterium]|nr:VLRF1 family aeRF1-type release factor [Solirubrobacterales bacterium]